jgi:Uma2 family endonuclease
VRLLDTHAEAHKLGEVYIAPFDVILSDRDVVQPDLLFIAAAHLERLTESGVRGAPDLTVEIVSEGSRRTDEVLKRKLYEAYGVQEYWVVDPEIQVVKVYRLAEGRFVRSTDLSAEAGNTLTSPLLPGLQVPLAVVFS